MKITESKLREMIREVIVELTGTSSSRGAKKTGHKTAEKKVMAEPRVNVRGGPPGTSTTYRSASPDSEGQPAKWRTRLPGRDYIHTHSTSTRKPRGTEWEANPDYKAWEKEKRDAQKKDTKATREKPKGQKDPAASAGRPSGKKGKKKGSKKKGKDEE